MSLEINLNVEIICVYGMERRVKQLGWVCPRTDLNIQERRGRATYPTFKGGWRPEEDALVCRLL